jgi:hypothetical protein
MPDDLEDRIQKVEYAIWGLRGDNGMMSDVRGLRGDLSAFIAAETRRREDEAKTQRSRDRALVTLLITVLITLLGVVAALLGHPLA